MDNEKITLALAFLQTHPESAAGILEQHDIREVAAFVADIPHSYATPVVQRMLPQYTARLCKLLPRDAVVGLFSHLELGVVTAILRYFDKNERSALLEELPTKTKLGCTLLLNYSHEMVGAWITPHIATIPFEYQVQDALNYLKSTPDIVHTDYVFTVDRERGLKGRISFTELLRANPELAVSALTETRCQTLSGRMLISHAAEHPDWKLFDVIPVLNRNHKFIGVLRHVDLRNGLDNLVNRIDQQPDQNALTGIGKVYGQSLFALFESMKEILASDIRSK